MPCAQLQRDWSETSFKIQALRDNPVTAQEEFDRILDDNDPGLNAVLTFDPGDNIARPYRGKLGPRIAVLREQGVNSQYECSPPDEASVSPANLEWFNGWVEARSPSEEKGDLPAVATAP